MKAPPPLPFMSNAPNFTPTTYFQIARKLFSDAIISDYQASNYNYYSVIRDCFFCVNEGGKETPVAIDLCEGNAKFVDGCMVSGFPIGIRLRQGGYGGNMLGSSITNNRIESSSGDSASYPGAHNAIGISVDYVYGLNISGNSFEFNGDAASAASGSRCITLTRLEGGNISGNHFQGHGVNGETAISVASANVKGVTIHGNKFHNYDKCIEVLSRSAICEIGMNDPGNSNAYADDSTTPTFTNLAVVVGGGSVAYSGRWRYTGNRVFFTLQVTPSGGATTASTNGSTYLTIPSTPSPSSMDVCYVADESGASLGTGLIYTDGRIYLPSWSARTYKIIISGNYQFQ
jgi:hypothetical protein